MESHYLYYNWCHPFSKQAKIFFRGYREDLDSKKQGNFLETVRIIAEYNLVMTEHLSDIQVPKKRMSTKQRTS